MTSCYIKTLLKHNKSKVEISHVMGISHNLIKKKKSKKSPLMSAKKMTGRKKFLLERDLNRLRCNRVMLKLSVT